MKKINLFNEIIVTSNIELAQALSSNKEFGITLKGEVKYAPFDPLDIFIYQAKTSPATALNTHTSKQELLGTDYTVVEDDDRILIKAGNAWQAVINYNVKNCHYDDTSGDGVDQFGDEEIEDMGWMIIDFDVSYKELVQMLEEKADITLIGIQSEEPYQFSGMGYFNDIETTRKILFDFCYNTIKDKIDNDTDYALDLLDEDQREAAEFFKVI